MKVNVRSIRNDEYSFDLDDTATVFELKDALGKMINVHDTYRIKLIYSGDILEELNKELKEYYKFKNNDIIIYYVKQEDIIRETVHVPEPVKNIVPIKNVASTKNVVPDRTTEYVDSDDNDDDSENGGAEVYIQNVPLRNNDGGVDEDQFKNLMDNNVFNVNNELTAADNIIIDEMEGMGFDRNMAAECYLLSNKNKEFALNMLLG